MATAKSVSKAAGKAVNDANPNVILAVGAILLGYIVVQKVFKKYKAQLPPGYTPPAGATITIEEAIFIATKIKSSLYSLASDYKWEDVAAEFEKLQNKYDVKMVFDAFGVAPGGILYGNLWEYLNRAYHTTASLNDGDYFDIIKIHSFDQYVNLTW